MATKIMVVDDEPDLTRLVSHHLEREGYQTVCVSNGTEALKQLSRQTVALVILDVMMPGESGLEVCKRLRSKAESAHLPILLLTAKDEETDKVIGLELGADDYVTKPFSPKELMARVKALLRRADRKEAAAVHTYGELVLDPARHEVTAAGKQVTLTAKEFSLLEYLIQRKGKALTRDLLLNEVWGYDYFGTTRTVDVHIRRLREKIPMLAEAIETIPSVGYKLGDDA